MEIFRLLSSLCFLPTQVPGKPLFHEWEYKKALIDTKYILDDMLRACSKFGSIEQAYIDEKEQQRTIGVIKNENKTFVNR